MMLTKKRCHLLGEAKAVEGKLMQKVIRGIKEGAHDIPREQSPTDRGPSWTLAPLDSLALSHL